MFKKLFKTIIVNNIDVVIFNYINFISENFLFEKNYRISNDFLNKSFSSFDIKEDFFNLFFWWPCDKILKKNSFSLKI
jgi:hypothetical protein